MSLSVWWGHEEQQQEAEGRGRLESPFIRVQILTQCIPFSPRSSVLFRCLAPAPWSLQQCGIDPATNVSINHSRTQQGRIVQRVFKRRRSGCRFVFPSLHTFLWGEPISQQPPRNWTPVWADMLIRWTDGRMDGGQEGPNKRTHQVSHELLSFHFVSYCRTTLDLLQTGFYFISQLWSSVLMMLHSTK